MCIRNLDSPGMMGAGHLTVEDDKALSSMDIPFSTTSAAGHEVSLSTR